MDFVFLEFMCFLAFGDDHFQRSQVEVRAPIATIRISLGWGLRECV